MAWGLDIRRVPRGAGLLFSLQRVSADLCQHLPSPCKRGPVQRALHWALALAGTREPHLAWPRQAPNTAAPFLLGISTALLQHGPEVWGWGKDPCPGSIVGTSVAPSEPHHRPALSTSDARCAHPWCTELGLSRLAVTQALATGTSRARGMFPKGAKCLRSGANRVRAPKCTCRSHWRGSNPPPGGCNDPQAPNPSLFGLPLAWEASTFQVSGEPGFHRGRGQGHRLPSMKGQRLGQRGCAWGEDSRLSFPALHLCQ